MTASSRIKRKILLVESLEIYLVLHMIVGLHLLSCSSNLADITCSSPPTATTDAAMKTAIRIRAFRRFDELSGSG